MNAFLRQAPRYQREDILKVLGGVLKRLEAPTGTITIAGMVAEALDLPLDHCEAVGRHLISLAKAGGIPEARRSSETFKRYGRTMHRLVWSPRRAAGIPAASGMTDAERLALAAVVNPEIFE